MDDKIKIMMPNLKPPISISELAKEVHANARNHGWWDTIRSVPEMLCLIHSEVSEALEAYRNHDDPNFIEELADIMIRVMDMAEGLDINIEEAIIRKHLININRPYKYGGKKC